MRHLYLSQCTKVPKALEQAPQLEQLMIRADDDEHLAESSRLSLLTSLNALGVEGKLAELPADLTSLQRLQVWSFGVLSLAGTPLRSLPKLSHGQLEKLELDIDLAVMACHQISNMISLQELRLLENYWGQRKMMATVKQLAKLWGTLARMESLREGKDWAQGLPALDEAPGGVDTERRNSASVPATGLAGVVDERLPAGVGGGPGADEWGLVRASQDADKRSVQGEVWGSGKQLPVSERGRAGSCSSSGGGSSGRNRLHS
ncbi:hypothetical protein N2152v2_002854 [Parachlorella kessleri]